METGLRRMETDENTLICFAARHDSTAADNPDQANSNFTRYLSEEIVRPNVQIEKMLRSVRGDVQTASDGNQNPDWDGHLNDEFYFVEHSSGYSTPPPPPTPRPAPRATPDSTPAPSSLPDGLEAFATSVWKHEWNADADTWADDFASQSSYCYYHDGNGSASRSYIREDRRKLLGRFPERHYDLVDSINVSAISSTEAEVTFVFKYRYTGEKNASGRSRVRYTARLINNRWQITKYDEAVTRN